jgi:hypothetical protein
MTSDYHRMTEGFCAPPILEVITDPPIQQKEQQ